MIRRNPTALATAGGNRLRLRPGTADALFGAALFLCTSGFVLWQNAHLTVLWDLSYILENATRISLGQLPYRDFPFPYAPLTFLSQAAIIRLGGRAIWHHQLYAAMAAGAASLLTWRILLRVLAASRLPARLPAAALSMPLVFLGIGGIFPHPFYDCDCTLFVLFCLWLLLRLEQPNYPAGLTFAGGALLAVPLFIKQNTGLAFLLSAAVCILWIAIWRRRAALLLAGCAAGVLGALTLLQLTVGLGNYYHWTIQFAAQRRLPAVATVLGIYADPALAWSYAAFLAGAALYFLNPAFRRSRLLSGQVESIALWLAALLMAVPFGAALLALARFEDPSDRAEVLLHLWPVLLLASLLLALRGLWRAPGVTAVLPLILLGTIHGAFLSQQLWGSTYALWPLLMILIAGIVAELAATKRSRKEQPGFSTRPLMAFAICAAVSLIVAGGFYATSHERLDYADLSGEHLEHSYLPALRGLAMRGDWITDFEELVTYSQREIPRNDAILSIPGEDLFYFTTGRTPRFPVLMMDNTVNPYSAEQLAQLARERNVRWVIVKRRLQLQEQPIRFRAQLLELLSHNYELVETLNNYEIYRRKTE